MVLKEANKVVAASSATYNTALEVGCPSGNLVLFQNAVDVKRFNPSINGFYIRDRLGINENPMVFTVRAHEPQKGIEYLIRAVPLVLEKVPNALFIIGGDGSLRSFHESLARRLGVSASIIFTGRIPESELPQFYAACDVFAIPSIVEAFGLVTTEAMACGKPVIGTDVGGIPDIIEDGVTGFLVKPRDSNALAQKIILILSSPELRKKMGEAGRESVEKKFNIKERAEKIIKLYESLF
jgi:phosphatidylinositol alpha-1,6-mannosyltransferase